MVINFHPDKLANKNHTESDRKLWNKIQDSFTTLTDQRKRQVYDATLEFDNFVPEKFDKKENFFDFFSNYFKRNSYWSKIKPVPTLGSLEDSNQKVNQFYEFWFSFQSNRDFKHEDEHDLEHASCREERKYMEKENRRLKIDLIKEEEK